MEKSIIYVNSKGKEFFIKENDKLDITLSINITKGIEIKTILNTSGIRINRNGVLVEEFERRNTDMCIEHIIAYAGKIVNEIKTAIDKHGIEVSEFKKDPAEFDYIKRTNRERELDYLNGTDNYDFCDGYFEEGDNEEDY